MRGWDLILAGRRWLYEPHIGVSTSCGAVSTPGDHRFCLRFSGVVDYGRISDPGAGSCPPRVGLALRTPGWGFYTIRGVIVPGGHRCRPRSAVVDVWKDF